MANIVAAVTGRALLPPLLVANGIAATASGGTSLNAIPGLGLQGGAIICSSSLTAVPSDPCWLAYNLDVEILTKLNSLPASGVLTATIKAGVPDS